MVVSNDARTFRTKHSQQKPHVENAIKKPKTPFFDVKTRYVAASMVTHTHTHTHTHTDYRTPRAITEG